MWNIAPQISLETANRFYAWGWRASLIGAAITAIGVLFLFWGTRVRDQDFETQMGTLNREAGNARERAARLEAVIAPRRLSKEQVASLTRLLEPFKGQKIRLESYALDAEGEVLASQIRDGLAPVLGIDDWVGSEGAGNGFAKGINVTGTNAALVTALAEAFQKLGLENVSTAPLPPPQTILLAVEQSRDREKGVAAVVVVGVKPIKQ